MKKRLEFSDKQKAQIFVRDCATCAFSGKSLWILDYHLCPTYDIDWVDHIKPATKGGGNEISNGVCASSFFNAKKKDNSHDNLYFFFAGKPTAHLFSFYEFLPDKVLENLKRFKNLHWSDWYLNRAFWMFMIALEYRKNPYLKNGKKGIRDDIYYSKACLKRILEWRKIKNKENASDLRIRGILPKDLSVEQKILLKLLDSENIDDVYVILDSASSLYENNLQAFESFLNNEKCTQKEMSKYMRKIISQKV